MSHLTVSLDKLDLESTKNPKERENKANVK